ncbi:beta-3 adrenergic receptor-like isoform X1 [Scylla paramamosain]|uniref:beta-3 adrenergic receptor-like isoform X1 n=1 Tax=Scylla paramamosain TaxID=85552 RepID=UPI003083D753
MQLGMVASIVFLAGLALDSFLASKPHRFPAQIRRRVLRAAVTVAWVAGLVLFTLTGLGIFRQGDMCLEAPLFLIHTHDGLFVCLLLMFLLPLVVLVASLALVLLKKEPPSVGRRNSENTRERTATGAGTGGRESIRTNTTPAGAKTMLPRSARLLVALSLVFAVTHLPYWTLRIHYSRARELLPFPIHAVIYCLALVGTALDPVLGVWFRVELWQGVVARLPSHPASAVPLHTV